MKRAKPEPLKDGSRDAELRERWIRTWEKVGRRILSLPLWMQNILLEDVNTAVTNRIALMEAIWNAQGKH
jgi:hypothetical protein